MSILIKGMEMPKCCLLCPLSVLNGERLYCEVTKDEVLRAKKPSDCPLVPVPPHGDLIDRGYAIATACSGRIRVLPTTEDGERWIRVEEVRESIKNAPTILPAEEE